MMFIVSLVWGKESHIFSYMNVKFLVYLVECICNIKIISGGYVLSLQQSTHSKKKRERKERKKKRKLPDSNTPN